MDSCEQGRHLFTRRIPRDALRLLLSGLTHPGLDLCADQSPSAAAAAAGLQQLAFTRVADSKTCLSSIFTEIIENFWTGS